MRHLTLAATVLATSCLVIGCSESQAAAVAGSYTLDADKTVASMMEGQTQMKGLDEAKKKEAAEQMKKMVQGNLQLSEDMTFSGTMEMALPGMEGMGGKQTIKGTWKVENDKITFHTTHEDGKEHKETKTGTIKDGVIQMTMEQGGQQVTLHFTKSK